MNAETGQSGVHVVKMTSVGGENQWSTSALVDYGPEHYLSPPTVLAVLDEETLRGLRDEISTLLE